LFWLDAKEDRGTKRTRGHANGLGRKLCLKVFFEIGEYGFFYREECHAKPHSDNKGEEKEKIEKRLGDEFLKEKDTFFHSSTSLPF